MDFNDRIIEEFRAKGGKLPGPAEASALLLLHTRGARSGAERVNPVTYQPLADGWAIFAAHAGSAKHPDWFHNLVAHPETIIEIETETVPVRARVTTGEDRERIWER
jgi:deazaflavin-dependent oxidoreductase (nitroreductase family)